MRSYAPAALLSLLSLAILSSAAPTSLDAATLLANAQEAQILNNDFQQLSVADPCIDGDIGCIEGAEAVCNGGSWGLQACPAEQQSSQSLQCFALPSTRRRGTIIACTTQANADNLIDSLGATGGAFGNGTDTGADDATDPLNPNDPTSTDTTDTADPTSTDDAGAFDPNAPQTVTLTLTFSDSSDSATLTLPSLTTTLAASDALGLLSTMTMTTTETDTSTDTSVVAPTQVIGDIGGLTTDSQAATTILLTTTPVEPTDVPDAAAAIAAPTITSMPPADGDSGYRYRYRRRY